MSYSANEGSRHSGAPIELYRFVIGGGVKRSEVTGGDTAVVTDGLEYADQAAAEAAGWTVTDTLGDSAWEFGATDQVYAGTKSVKANMQGTGVLAGSGALKMTKTFDTGDGLSPNTVYLVTVRGRQDQRSSFDVHSRLIVSGATGGPSNAAITSENTWEQLVVPAMSNPSGELTVTLQRQHPFVTQTRAVYFDARVYEAAA
jgi:hypothetical protein